MKTNIKKVAIILAYTLLFWIIIPGIIIYSSFLLDKKLYLTLPFSILWLITGSIIALFSIGMLFLSIFQLKKFGHGLPISALPPKKLAQKGVYAVWRHPIYLFFTLFLLGLALVIRRGSLLTIMIPLLIVIEILYITIEEKFLVKRYGEKYKYYKHTTALIVPGLIHFLKAVEHLPFKLLFSLKILNKENIPDDSPFFIISSHRNYFDPFFIIKIINRPVHFVATYEIFRNPLSGFIFKKLHSIPKKRYRQDIPAVQKIIKLIKQDAVIGIFPEGKRSWTGSIDTFKPEVLKLLKKFRHIPVLPLKLEGNYFAWPRWGKNIRRSNITLIIQKPYYIEKDQSLEDIEEQIKKLIKPDDSKSYCKSRQLSQDIRMVIYRCPVCRSFKSMRIISNTRFRCDPCRTVFFISPDYAIKYRNGGTKEKESVNSLYNKIKIQKEDIKPLSPEKKFEISALYNFKGDIAAYCDRVFVYKEKKNKLAKLFAGLLFLTKDSLLMTDNRNIINIQLEKVTSVTIESNDKLQIYNRGENLLHQVIFPDDSALKWQDYILKTIESEFSFYPNRR